MARRSCSSAPVMPEVGMSRASCHASSAIGNAPVLTSDLVAPSSTTAGSATLAKDEPQRWGIGIRGRLR